MTSVALVLKGFQLIMSTVRSIVLLRFSMTSVYNPIWLFYEKSMWVYNFIKSPSQVPPWGAWIPDCESLLYNSTSIFHNHLLYISVTDYLHLLMGCTDSQNKPVFCQLTMMSSGKLIRIW